MQNMAMSVLMSSNASPSDPEITISYPLLFLQVVCFANLYAIWMLPGTIALRNTCLGLGALASIYPIYQARHYFFRKSAIPAWLLVTLFIWAVFHLLFLAQSPVLQYEEFTSIWKRTFIGAFFALGFGITLSVAITENANKQKVTTKKHICWLTCKVIAYLGLFSPTAIYLIKYGMAAYGPQLGFVIAHSLQPYIGPKSIYIPKTSYMCFCIPMLANALGFFYANLVKERWFVFTNIVYLLSIVGVLWVFNGENIKNGFVIGLLLITIFILFLGVTLFKKHFFKKMIVIGLITIASFFLLNLHVTKNESWKTFAADTKIAWQTEQYPQWRTGQLPNNELGRVVSGTNYERIAWAKEGVKMIVLNPLGFGLIEQSFGRLAAGRWAGTTLTQSHSGWIDLALGIGIPGLALVLGTLLLLLPQLIASQGQSNPILGGLWWILLAMLLMWCTTEISQKVYFDALIFWLSLGAGLTLTSSRPNQGLS
jgi:hypothetical protein